MSRVKAKCSACGVPLEVSVAETFAAAELAVPLCPAYTDCQVLDGGGSILELRHEPEGPASRWRRPVAGVGSDQGFKQ
jgi:hypothetical protein